MSIRHLVYAIIIFAAGFMFNANIGSGSLLHSGKSFEPAINAQTPQTPSTPTRWEYRLVTASKGGLLSGGMGGIENELNRLGAQGFEIYSVTQSSADVGVHLTIVLRRQKQ
jgi:hypothetical protein